MRYILSLALSFSLYDRELDDAQGELQQYKQRASLLEAELKEVLSSLLQTEEECVRLQGALQVQTEKREEACIRLEEIEVFFTLHQHY